MVIRRPEKRRIFTVFRPNLYEGKENRSRELNNVGSSHKL